MHRKNPRQSVVLAIKTGLVFFFTIIEWGGTFLKSLILITIRCNLNI